MKTDMTDMMDMENLEKIIDENERLKRLNGELLEELKVCRDDICKQIEAIYSIKNELRRYEVQLNSLKTENEAFKNKFAKIENNSVGKLMLGTYRMLREIKRRYISQ